MNSMDKLISSQINNKAEKGSLNCDGKCHEGSCYSGFAVSSPPFSYFYFYFYEFIYFFLELLKVC